MENENYKKKTTAPDTSVGADDGQPLHNSTAHQLSFFIVYNFIRMFINLLLRNFNY